jgi:hypothetical protein
MVEEVASYVELLERINYSVKGLRANNHFRDAYNMTRKVFLQNYFLKQENSQK